MHGTGYGYWVQSHSLERRRLARILVHTDWPVRPRVEEPEAHALHAVVPVPSWKVLMGQGLHRAAPDLLA